jgi:hypothetical protein
VNRIVDDVLMVFHHRCGERSPTVLQAEPDLAGRPARSAEDSVTPEVPAENERADHERQRNPHIIDVAFRSTCATGTRCPSTISSPPGGGARTKDRSRLETDDDVVAAAGSAETRVERRDLSK